MKNSQLLAEFLGTFFLVTVVAFTGNPLAIGAILMVMVYVWGHISGAHFNPAVTYAFFLKKKMTGEDTVRYWAAQFLGAIAASSLYLMTNHKPFLPQAAAKTTLLQAIGVEAIFTFLLVTTILHVAADNRVKGNQYFGLAIGAALFIGATVGGPISGGAFNPAVGVGPWLLQFQTISLYFSTILTYLCGPLLGAAVASWVSDFDQKN